MRTFFLFFYLILSLKTFSQSSIKGNLELVRYKALAKYKDVGYFDTLTLLAPFNADSTAGYINSYGREICKFKNAITYGFSDEVGVVKQNEKYFLVNKKGSIVRRFNNISSLHQFKNGEALIGQTKNGVEKFGIMRVTGDIKIKCQYSNVEKISSNYYLVTNNGVGQGVINSNQDTIIPLNNFIKYVDTVSLNFIGSNPRFGYGKFSFDLKPIKLLDKNFYYESIYIDGKHHFQRDSLIIVKDKFSGNSLKYCLLNLNLDTVVPLGKFTKIGEINEGLIVFANLNDGFTKKNKLSYGYFNKSGSIIIKDKYDFAMYFTEGLACVNINNKWGYINKSDETIIPIRFDYALTFRNGFAEVLINKKRFLINKKGETVLEITKHN